MEEEKKPKSRKWLFPLLFIVTLITTTIAGAEWMYGRPLMYFEPGLTFEEVLMGIYFSFPLLGFLTIHEFGHYFTAKYYNIRVSLPYYIPLWLGFAAMPFTIGTMGAVIRIKERIRSKKEYFDVGIAGPLAGFVAALFILYYGFTHLPEPEHIFTIHPEYKEYGLDYADHVYDEEGTFHLGSNLTFWFFENYVASDPSRVPNPYEIIHYPWLFAGFLALFVTAMNLLPVGQLDGGHVLYGLFGWKKHKRISVVTFFLLITYGGLGLITPFDPLEDLLIFIPLYIGLLYFAMRSIKLPRNTRLTIAASVFTFQFIIVYFFPNMEGYPLWLFFAFIIGRFLGIYHPPAMHDDPLSPGRKILGWIALIVFIISFSPRPFVII